MTDAVLCTTFSAGPPEVSAAALVELLSFLRALNQVPPPPMRPDSISVSAPCALRFERRMIRRFRSFHIAVWISTFRSVSFETPIGTSLRAGPRN
jgi:hypothetical protein